MLPCWRLPVGGAGGACAALHCTARLSACAGMEAGYADVYRPAWRPACGCGWQAVKARPPEAVCYVQLITA